MQSRRSARCKTHWRDSDTRTTTATSIREPTVFHGNNDETLLRRAFWMWWTLSLMVNDNAQVRCRDGTTSRPQRAKGTPYSLYWSSHFLFHSSYPVSVLISPVPDPTGGHIPSLPHPQKERGHQLGAVGNSNKH